MTTALADRLKVLTPDKVIALGDLFIPVVMALEACADEASSWIEQHYTADVRKYASEQRRYERDNACVLEARALLVQIADRLTAK